MKIGVIGCGNMATAMVCGAKARGFEGEWFGVSRTVASREKFCATTGARGCESVKELVSLVDVVLVATKPAEVVGVLREVMKVVEARGKLVLSVAAGISLGAMAEACGGGLRLVRVMPNTPAQIGKGATAYCRGEGVSDEDAAWVEGLLATLGMVVEVAERQMDAVVGVSGSGPAYVYVMIEAMADAGVAAGLGREQALRLAAQTLVGAGAMVLETGENPAVLKDRVTSPGGTTAAALVAMEKAGLRAALQAGVMAAVARSRELGG